MIACVWESTLSKETFIKKTFWLRKVFKTELVYDIFYMRKDLSKKILKRNIFLIRKSTENCFNGMIASLQ